MDRRAADGATGVHPPGLDRIVAVDDPQVVPVERAEHRELVVDEVLARVEPLTGLEDDDTQTALAQLLGQNGAGRAAADDAGVDLPLVAAHDPAQVLDARRRHLPQ